jgi:hypothetical protein
MGHRTRRDNDRVLESVRTFYNVFKCATRRRFAGWRWKTFDALAIVVAGVKLAAA